MWNWLLVIYEILLVDGCWWNYKYFMWNFIESIKIKYCVFFFSENYKILTPYIFLWFWSWHVTFDLIYVFSRKLWLLEKLVALALNRRYHAVGIWNACILRVALMRLVYLELINMLLLIYFRKIPSQHRCVDQFQETKRALLIPTKVEPLLNVEVLCYFCRKFIKFLIYFKMFTGKVPESFFPWW